MSAPPARMWSINNNEKRYRRRACSGARAAATSLHERKASLVLPLGEHSRTRERAAACRRSPPVGPRTREVDSCILLKRQWPSNMSAERPWCKLHGQGPRAEARAARRLPPMSCEQRVAKCKRRDAVTLAMQQPARPADRSRAVPASHQSWAARS